MQRRHLNIPIEIVRTVIAVSETRSLTKAADQLGLSQPAVSSQIKRLEQIVGGTLFSKTPNGSCATDLGRLVLAQARKIIEANDQVLALGGDEKNAFRLRLGLSSVFTRSFLLNQAPDSLGDVQIRVGSSAEISAALIGGHVDVACFLQRGEIDSELSPLIVDESEDRLIWVRSPNFVLSPGAPIPIVTWANHDWMISTLTRHGLSYRIAFNSTDFESTKSAVEASVGLTALPSRLLSPAMVWAREFHLPELPTIKTLLCIRPGIKAPQLMDLKHQLSALCLNQEPSLETDKVA
jgi:DNA-binding transcriptional LysR family regulator